ncbi:uncharacterized protein [Onthophagus taurus]|uniref:uncharacterized protein n=1 Tax=Onthophagus taurus TaxID=166361 RepID=UPI0039BE313B
MSQSENLTKKRGIVKGKLTNFAKFVIKFESNIRESGINQELSLELEQRYNRAINLIDEFEEIQGEIDLLSVDGESQNAERETFEESFYANTAKAKRILTNRNICADSSFIVGPSPDQHVKLPVIDLPKFDGGYDAWLGFRDIFESLIHNNPMINDIQKFHYLLSALTGNARQVIESLELTNSNYEVAWGLIRERYDNPRILIHNHVKALFEIEGVSGDNPQPIRSFIDDFRKHLRALAALNEPTDNWDTLLIYLAVSKLDADSNREWERKKSGLNKANLENLLGFLKERADLLETLENGSGKRIIDKSKPKSKTFLVANSGVKRCVNCNGEHYIQECSNFTKLTVRGRIDRVKQLKVCMNCLRSGHFVKQCRSSSCKRCNSRHHTLLHLTHDRLDSPPQPTTSTQAHSLNFAQHANHSNILLSTVTVHAFDRHNKKHSLRALLDPGSQSSFLSVEACKRLRLARTATNVNVATINQTQSTITSSCSLRIHSHCTDFSLKVNCLVIATIANDLPNFEINANTLKIPTHIRLADPLFNKPDKIDMLVGADYFWNLLCVGQIKLAKGPIMQNTRLGWIVSGPIQASAAHSVRCNLIYKDDNSVISKQLARFREVEEFEGLVHSSKNETFCKNHFYKTTKRAEDGRFIVSTPLKKGLDWLGESHKTAENSLMGIERKCKRNREFGEQYHTFMREYLELGQLRKIVDTREGYYISHGVLNENSAITRVVFDASCPTSMGYSLNNCQIVGPILQPDLFSALKRFREYEHVATADMQKMYRACLINPTELSKECFIAALRRLSARRGKPNRMFSDSGTKFVGGNRELQELSLFLIDNSSELKTPIENASNSWLNTPPNLPHLGGLWEGGVKSVKFHLRRVTGNASFTYENFYTLSVQIEAILNSRPLTPLSTDPNDTTLSTPAHFLIGGKLTFPPDPGLSRNNEDRLSQFHRVQQIQQHFWTRWSKAYLSELQRYYDWFTGDANLRLGRLVSMKKDNLPTLKWLTGRIIELHCDKDGVARVVTHTKWDHQRGHGQTVSTTNGIAVLGFINVIACDYVNCVCAINHSIV